MQFSVKPNIIVGDDALDIFKKYESKRILFVTDPFMVQSKMVDLVLEAVPKNCHHDIFTEVKPDPSQDLVDRGMEKVISYKPDCLVALGGGSAIDAAKAMIYGLEDKNFDFIAIPTTAGTGSEVTNFAVITVGLDKLVLIDDKMLPTYALLVPKFTKTVPGFLTADTGMDVLTHALEAYVSKQANNFTDIFAEKAVSLVYENLHRVYEDGSLMSARKNMLEASCMAGIGFTNAGLGINHSLAHTIGGRFHIAHGRLNAILLPYVLTYNIENSEMARKKYRQLAQGLGLADERALIAFVKDLNQKLGIPQKLRELNKISELEYFNQIEAMADTAMKDRCTPTNPSIVTKIALINILRDIF